MRCATCGATGAVGARFCDQCGASLGAGQAGPGAIGVSSPKPTADDDGDRRIVTALFADLVDYVRMVAEHDPEVVRRRVRAALTAMADAIERLGGTREKFIGDAVFAVFGWPRAHDDDAIRAALAALAIRSSLRDLGDGAEAMEVRIGIATGEVVTSRADPISRRPGPHRVGHHDRGPHPVPREAGRDPPGFGDGRRRPGTSRRGGSRFIRVARPVGARPAARPGGGGRTGRLLRPPDARRRHGRRSRARASPTPRAARPMRGNGRRRRDAGGRRPGHREVAPVRGPGGRGEAARDGLDVDREHLLRSGRAIPIRADVRAGRGGRARHRLGQLCAGAPVHAGPRRDGRPPVRRRDRGDRPGRRLLRLGGGSTRYADGLDGTHDHAGRGRRAIRRPAHRDERATGRGPRRPALGRCLEFRDGRGPRRAGVTVAAHRAGGHAAGRTTDLGESAGRGDDRAHGPVDARDGPARHPDRPGRPRCRRGEADPPAHGRQPALRHRDGPGITRRWHAGVARRAGHALPRAP